LRRSRARRQYNGKKASQEALVKLQSTIRCTICGQQKTEEMPVNACRFFFDCESCGARLKPKEGDCCVFCSYGDVLCPPMQEARADGNCCVAIRKTGQ
jgi:hypothetical protein